MCGEDTPITVFILLDQISHLSKYCAMKKMESMDLKPGQAGILFILNKEGGMSQKHLAQKMGITPPSMTVALRKLEAGGYVEKEPDKSDQRILQVRLTEKGRACIAMLRSITDEMEELLFRNLSREEQLLVKRLLLEMRNNLIGNKEFKGMDMHSAMEKARPPLPISEKEVF